MKTRILILAMLLLWGCSPPPPATTETPLEVAPTIQKIEGAQLNEPCGGPENIPCAARLICKKKDNRAHEIGKCISSIADTDVECPTTQAPVCGVKNNIKNGYLNDCEAERHGATKVNDGLCTKNPNVVGSCTSFIQIIGNCPDIITGVEFDGEKCHQKDVRGCDADIPFRTIEECEKKCL